MSDLSAFHFIRPFVLALIPAILLIWWLVRARATRPMALPAGIAPHLAHALQVGTGQRARVLPIDGVAALALLIAIAAAGPTWSRIPNPLLAQTAPLAVLVEASDAMKGVDVAPSRMARAKQKVYDLLDTRAGARTALIAYAGTAHRVTPLTDDPEVIRPFVEGLTPEIMPRQGDNATAALALAAETMASEPVPGAILFIAGQISSGDLGAFRSHAADGGVPIVVLLMSKGQEGASEIASVPNTSVIALTPDGSDIFQIERLVARAFEAALANDDRQQWEDKGWLLAWPAAFMMVLWFRRGWTMRWNFLFWIAVMAMPAAPAKAEGVADWFYTPDQQGQRAFDDKEFSEAADLFEDPEWRGYALYRSGRYEEAAQFLAQIDTPEAALTQGLAHIKFRQYRDGIRAFETALKRRPDYPEAARNLEVAKAIVAYVEKTQEQSSTEEGSEGADEIRYDKETKKGTETVLSEAKGFDPTSADQWMRTVETRTGDFLRGRFSLEASRGQQ